MHPSIRVLHDAHTLAWGALLSATLALPLQSQQSVPSAATSRAVDDLIRREMRKRHITGLSVAVINGGAVVKSKGFGMANVELSVPATDETVYQIASITKPFTASAIMLLAADGQISLDTPITAYLDSLPAAWSAITVRQLLAHTSGLDVKRAPPSARLELAQRELIELAGHDPLAFAPGTGWLYSNTGYSLLGMLIERVSGKPYGEFLTERIFAPLRMSHTHANDLAAVIPHRASGYGWQGRTLRNGDYVSPSLPFAAGMLVSTVGDLAKWDMALSSGALLDSSTLATMWTPTTASKRGGAGYGLGWETSQINGRRVVAHNGSTPGFSAQFTRFVDDDLTVVVLVNANGRLINPSRLAQQIAGLYVPRLARIAQKPIPDPNPALTARLRIAVDHGMHGELDRGAFTEALEKGLAPLFNFNRENNALLGSIEALDLLERTETEQGLQLKYRAVLENDTVIVYLGVDRAGRISSWGVRSDD